MGIQMTYFCLCNVTHNSKRQKPFFFLLRLLPQLFLTSSISHFYIFPCICIQSLHIVLYMAGTLSPQLSDSDIQSYHDTYRPRMGEMHAFNLVSIQYIVTELVSAKNIFIPVK